MSVVASPYNPSHLGGGPFNGYSPVQSLNGYQTTENINSRRIVTKAWNKKGAVGIDSGHARVINPFRAVNSSGDFLSRQNYVCGGPNPVNRTQNGKVMMRVGNRPQNNCDGTNVEAGNCNPKYVHDSSDYIRYRKLRTFNRSYNDLSYGGDESNASYTSIMSVVGGKKNKIP